MCDDGLILVVVSPKCKAVAPTCGQAFSWEFYSGTPSHFCMSSCVAAEWWLCFVYNFTCRIFFFNNTASLCCLRGKKQAKVNSDVKEELPLRPVCYLSSPHSNHYYIFSLTWHFVLPVQTYLHISLFQCHFFFKNMLFNVLITLVPHCIPLDFSKS